MTLLLLLTACGSGGGGSSSSTGSYSGAASLSWVAPETNTDGSPLDDLSGYKVYYGTSPGDYSMTVDVGNVTSSNVMGLIPGTTYYFALTAYDRSGNESSYSREVAKTSI